MTKQKKLRLPKIKWNSEKVLSLSAMSISFITLLIFIYQTNLMSRQNALSIMPYLDIHTTVDNGNSTFVLSLKNQGVGPAIIESVHFEYEEKSHNLQDYQNDMFDFLQSKIPALDSIQEISTASLERGMAIPANTSYTIIAVRNAKRDFEQITQTLEQMLAEGLDYKIVYKSIQSEKWVIHHQSEGPKRWR